MIQNLSMVVRHRTPHTPPSFRWAGHITVVPFLMFLLAIDMTTLPLTNAAGHDSVSIPTGSVRSELHVVAVADGLMPNGTKRPRGESSPHAPAEVHVNVTVLDVPINLLLVASSRPVNPTSKPITWKIHASPNVNISRIVIIGDEPQSVEGNIHREQWTVIPTSKDLWLPHTQKYHDIFTKRTTDLFGMAPVTYQFFQYGGNVLVDGITTQCQYRFGQDINKELERRESSRSLHALEALSKSPRVNDREQAAIGYRLHCQSAVPFLSRLIEDPEPSVRKLTIETLASLKIGTERFAPILRVLEDPDKSVRMSAMDAEVSMRDLRALPALVKTLTNVDQNLRLAASQAIAALAPYVFHHKLGITLRDEDLDLRKDTFKAFVPNFVAALEDQDPEIKINIARILSTLGPYSEAAVPSLMRLIHSDGLEVKKAAAVALQRIGMTSVESVLALVDAREAATDEIRIGLDKAFESVSPSVMPQLDRRLRAASSDAERLRVVIGIRLTGQPYPSLIPALLKLCGSDFGRLESEAALALAIIGDPGTEEVQDLLRSLGHSDPRIKSQSLKVLARSKTHTQEIASAAVSLLQDRDPAVRTEARTTVRALGNQGIDQLVIRLQQALEQDRPELLDALTYAMDKTHMEYRARNAAPVAGLLLGHQDQQVRVHAASVLRQIGIHAVEPLIVQISQSSGKEEAQLREALQSLGPPPTAILRDVMTKTDLPLAARYEALSITKSLWENGDKSVADSSVALVALLKDEDAGLRSTAAQLLGEFGTLASHSIPDLIECLKDPQETVRGSVLQALQRMGRDALPWLIETVEHGDSAVKLSAVQAIAGSNLEHMHGLEKPQFQKALREVLEDPDTEVRFYAAVALARMHIPDTQAINVLANALSSSTFMMRLQAVQALGKIAPAAVSAMDRLTSLATADENQAVKTEAATVLARMRLFAPLPSEAAAGPPRECQTMSPQDLAHSLREAHATALAAYRARADAEEALRVFAASCMPPASSATPGPLPKGEYAALLNDFAFFELEQYKALPIEKQALSRAIVDDAIARLRTVLELLPRRAVAHLNLTEALLLHSQFLEFDHLIQHSKSYKRFSKQPLDATGEWLLSLSSTIDACRFTVALKDKGRLMDASALANQGLIDIDNDGLTDRISFRRTESGTPSSLAITFGNPDKTDESDESPEGSGLYHPDTYPGGKLMVMGFKQKYYLVHYRDSSHGLLLSHLEELNDAGSKTLCEFANTATESLPSALDKERVRLGSALLKKTIKYGVEQNSYVILGKEAIGPLQSLLTSQPIQGTGILLWKGSIDIDNDGRAETMGLIRVYTSPGAYLDLFVKGNEDLTNFPDDWMNHFLLMQAQAGFTLRPFTWKGATYLEKRSDMHTTFVHEIITLDKGTANAVLSFDITLQSQFSRYGDAPDTATRGPDRNSVKVIANIPR